MSAQVTHVVRLAGGRLSTRVDPRLTAITCAFALAAVGIGLYACTVGELSVPVSEVVQALLGVQEAPSYLVVRDLRLPRVLAGLLVGVALGMSGTIFQGLVRNPLVSPDIIGVNAGASVVAVVFILSRVSSGLVPLGAFIGAVTAAGAIYALAWRRGVAGTRLVLVGIGVNAVLLAIVSFVIATAPSVEGAALALRWTTGSLFGSDWSDIQSLAIGLAILAPAAVILTHQLRLLQLGDDAARGLGQRTELVRAALLVVGSGLAAVAVAVAGPVGFVALVVPHAARLVARQPLGGALLLAGAMGGLLVVLSDLVAQRVLAPTSLPVGIVTSVIGSVYFAFLLYRYNRVLT